MIRNLALGGLLLAGAFVGSFCGIDLAEANILTPAPRLAIKALIYPQTLTERQAEIIDLGGETEENFVQTLIEKYGDQDAAFRSPEYVSRRTRSQLFLDLTRVLLKRHGDYPKQLSIEDIGAILQYPYYFEKQRTGSGKSQGMVFDPYRTYLSPDVALATLATTLEYSPVLPVGFAAFSQLGGTLAWIRAHDISQVSLKSFYHALMMKADSDDDLAIFMTGYIDAARENADRRFTEKWRLEIKPAVQSALIAHGKDMRWLLETAYPFMLKNASRKEGWEAPSPFIYGFKESLQSYLILCQQEGLFPLLKNLGSNSSIETAVQILNTFLISPRSERDDKTLQAATEGIFTWSLPQGLSITSLRTQMKSLLNRGEFDIRPEWFKLVNSISATPKGQPYNLGGAMWNVPFQLELQRFLSTNSNVKRLSPTNFFAMAAYLGEQDLQVGNYQNFVASLQTLEDFNFSSARILDRIAVDLNVVTGRPLEDSPNFKNAAPALAASLWAKYHQLKGPNSTRTDWILETVSALVRNGDQWQTNHINSFFSLLLLANQKDLQAALEVGLGSDPRGQTFTMNILSRYGSNAIPYMEELLQKTKQQPVRIECEGLLL